MKKVVLIIMSLLISTATFAYAIEVANADGKTICYNYIKNGTELAVARYSVSSFYDNRYAGNIVIPQEVTFMNRTRKVTQIDADAFGDCGSLTSVTIPNSVTSIGKCAFQNCQALTSVNIPNGVTSIGEETFDGCWALASITIPNSVTSIGASAFYECRSLTSITIPNSVTRIGASAFYYSGLTSVTIPNSVTSIPDHAFYGCHSLTSVNIPNSVTSIGSCAFMYCRSLTSVIIPNSVTSIPDSAFYDCRSLTSVTIPNSVTSIGASAFDKADIPTIITLMENPCRLGNNVFTNNTYKNATLFVPTGTINKYREAVGWRGFLFIEERDNHTPEKCFKPSISYSNGQLKFNCHTEGVEYHSSITDTDIKDYTAGVIDLSVTYNISVYATKEGYENSETATATLCWIDAEPWAEGTKEAEDNVTEVKAMPVLIQTEGNIISVQGAAEGTDISVYNTAGIMLNSAIAKNGITTLNTTLPSGSTAIVKIGEKAVKVLVK